MEWVIESYDRRTSRDAEHSCATASAFISAAEDLLHCNVWEGFVSATPSRWHNRPRRTGTPGSNPREHGWALRPTEGHTRKEPFANHPWQRAQKCWRSDRLHSPDHAENQLIVTLYLLCYGDDLTEEHRPCRPNPSAPSASPFTPASPADHRRPRRTKKGVNCAAIAGPAWAGRS